jgi:hypothetical protein
LGSVYPGIPTVLGKFLQKEYDLSTFIETGTWMASTALWAASFFQEVYTIELSEKIYKYVSDRYKRVENVHFICGASSSELSSILVDGFRPALLWLDAHWSDGDTGGENMPCPLLDEIKIILRSNPEHIILIDDARLILVSPPKYIRETHDLPSYVEVLNVLDSSGPRYTVMWRDVLISVPNSRTDSLNSFIKAQGDLVFFNLLDPEPGSNIGIRAIIGYWGRAFRALRCLPGAISRKFHAGVREIL